MVAARRHRWHAAARRRFTGDLPVAVSCTAGSSAPAGQPGGSAAGGGRRFFGDGHGAHPLDLGAPRGASGGGADRVPAGSARASEIRAGVCRRMHRALHVRGSRGNAGRAGDATRLAHLSRRTVGTAFGRRQRAGGRRNHDPGIPSGRRRQRRRTTLVSLHGGSRGHGGGGRAVAARARSDFAAHRPQPESSRAAAATTRSPDLGSVPRRCRRVGGNGADGGRAVSCGEPGRDPAQRRGRAARAAGDGSGVRVRADGWRLCAVGGGVRRGLRCGPRPRGAGR